LASIEEFQNFKVSMAKVKKDNIAVTYKYMPSNPYMDGQNFNAFLIRFTSIQKMTDSIAMEMRQSA
jgi:hypothetical protein